MEGFGEGFTSNAERWKFLRLLHGPRAEWEIALLEMERLQEDFKAAQTVGKGDNIIIVTVNNQHCGPFPVQRYHIPSVELQRQLWCLPLKNMTETQQVIVSHYRLFLCYPEMNNRVVSGRNSKPTKFCYRI